MEQPAERTPKLVPMQAVPNPYTDESPLVVRNRPWRDNLTITLLGLVLILGTSAYLIWSLVTGEPSHDAAGLLAVIGIPLGVVLLWFMFRLGTGAVVALGDETISRVVRRPEAHTASYAVRDISGGIYAANVKYSALSRPGAELVLFVPGGRLLWLADGISARDIGRLAVALSSHHIDEIPGQIRNRTLRVIMRKINTER
ncbi:hypothetical protein CLV47_11049 [Antricoccus suffuscus]|uniref:Uncharacterized protein n=1 Tax=Antricoccus suffuscus TaxID=1629062 RepID=A0A2T0ZY88_9ACTN|nr:hypothetical protein [Antricoccus suffuscus]PRZ41322.1 hypothetical protein CLV47_11049 [Antricoccus suffuscus]